MAFVTARGTFATANSGKSTRNIVHRGPVGV
jgi:hypothetical protein